MDLSAIDAALRQAVGQSRTVDDHVTPAAVERLAVTLDSGEPVPASGDPLPWGWHAVFCLKAPARAELEADGLPVRFDQIPPVPMQRRLFGGARLTFHTPLLIGQPVRCESELIDVKTRSTAGAHLAIATLRHRFSGPGGLAVEEEQDIIHMEPVGNAAEKPAANPAPMLAPTWQRHFTPDPVMLFRFSALTFNSHRIHYDAPYSADVEKLPGLMVQGRLISLQLLETVRVRAPKARLQRFEYRSGSPLFVGGACALNARLDDVGRSARLWAEDTQGRVVQTAALALAEPATA